MYLLVTANLIASMSVTNPNASQWIPTVYMADLIRNDLGLVLRPAPCTLAKIINGKLWVLLNRSDGNIKQACLWITSSPCKTHRLQLHSPELAGRIL